VVCSRAEILVLDLDLGQVGSAEGSRGLQATAAGSSQDSLEAAMGFQVETVGESGNEVVVGNYRDEVQGRAAAASGAAAACFSLSVFPWFGLETPRS